MNNIVLRVTKKIKTEAFEFPVKYKNYKKLYKYLKSKNINLFYFAPPNYKNIKNLSDFEIDRIKNWIFDFNNIITDIDKLKKIYGDTFTEQYLQKIYDGSQVIQIGKNKKLLDFHNEYVNIVNGIRLTTEQPIFYKHKIHIYGPCIVRGNGVEDSQTIASFIQKEMNVLYPNSYRVVNHGIGRGSNIDDDFTEIENTFLKSGDIVIICELMGDTFGAYCRINKIPYFDLSHLFNRPNEYGEWFTDNTVHTNCIGNKVIADYMKHVIFLKDEEVKKYDKVEYHIPIIQNNNNYSEITENCEFQHYIDFLKSQTIPYNKQKIGAIVMNCNPFTYGHRYLIERALEMVGFLYIFVVEEDKSIFSFNDRISLVMQGISDLENVKVLPSGKFIISTVTFPGYFYKDNINNAPVDPSQDIEIFARFIAPILQISMRFAGEEPLDMITSQYNETMKEILPAFGIAFCEVKRKKCKNQVISASKVRKLMKEHEYEKIKALVPKSTYEYLIKTWSDK